MEENPYYPTELDSIDAAREIRKLYTHAVDSRTDGFSACSCKHRMFLLKCLIEDLYKNLPDFPEQEKQWEQERLIQLLKQNT